MSTAFDSKWLKRQYWWSWSLDQSGDVEVSTRWFLVYGFISQTEGNTPNRAVAAVEEATLLHLSSRSALWEAAAISIERRLDWLVFSRDQDDLSIAGLKNFAADCSAYLDYLLEEATRHQFVREKD